jgi:putative N6-adenine-specific DNA methylase
VLLRVGEPFRATAFPELVRKAGELPWERFVRNGTSVAFRVTCRKSRLYHSDAVAERLHAALEARTGYPVQLARVESDEDPSDAQLFLARFERDVCTVSVDTSGALLHQRGWRGPQGKAPLRETLAAAMLLATGFRGDEPVCDPLCGSGTIAIEAALIAMRRAPGVRRAFAFQRWPRFSARQWEHLLAEARKQERALVVRVEASDQDAGAVAAARANAARAGVEIDVVQRRLSDVPPDSGTGLLASNLPYGKRIGADLRRLFHDLGESAQRRSGWRVAAIVAQQGSAAASAIGLAPVLQTLNGGIPVGVFASDGRQSGKSLE